MRLSLVLALLIASGLAFAAFEYRTLLVTINLNPDGSSHVEEVISFVVNTSESRELYESTFRYNQLSDWKERIGLEEMRHHISRAHVDISGLRIRPQPVERCNPFLGICQASLIFDYDVRPTASSPGLLLMDNYKPRTTKYQLVSDALSFDTTKSGDILLEKNTKLAIILPKDAAKIYFSKEPDNLATQEGAEYEVAGNTKYYAGPERAFSWESQTLSKFELSYEREETLESEVVQFFKNSQEAMARSAFSTEGLASLFIVAVLIVSAIYINRVRK